MIVHGAHTEMTADGWREYAPGVLIGQRATQTSCVTGVER